jgi:hypothetical protein
MPARTEIVVDEAEVVRVQAPGARGDRLPPLPRALDAMSPAFQRGYALAEPLLEAPPASAPPDAADAYRAWVESAFKPWLNARASAVQDAFAALAEVLGGPADEHVVAAALVGSIAARVHAQLVAVPAPPELRADEKLLQIYQNEVNGNAASWLGQAIAALRDCALSAAHQSDPAFGPWVEACQARMSPLEQADAQARALAERLAAEREAERLAAEGPRPPGPEMCWLPSVPAPAGPVSPAAADAAPQAATGTSGKPRKCARTSDTVAAPAAAISPRDQRYGTRDAKTGVRVSAMLGDNPGLDARPLFGDDVRARLAGCFAQRVAADTAITLVLRALLEVDARGRVTAATITPETQEPASALDPRLVRCMQQALLRSAFDCTASGSAVQASATYCLRRD